MGALPLAAFHALLAMQHLPPMCDDVAGAASTPAADWAAGLACRRGAAAAAVHWVAMGLLPALLMRAIDGAQRRRFVQQLSSSCLRNGRRAVAGLGSGSAGSSDAEQCCSSAGSTVACRA